MRQAWLFRSQLQEKGQNSDVFKLNRICSERFMEGYGDKTPQAGEC
jgi:hypothetical protein